MFTPAQSMKIAMDALETSMAAATTIGARLPMLWGATMLSSPRVHRESRRMVQEKLVAAAEGAVAAGSAACRLWMRMLTTMSVPTAWQIAELTDAAIAPARNACKANARRLGRTRKR